jgi:hypothetical protein
MARNYDPLKEWEDYVPDVYGDDGLRERARFEENLEGAIVVEIKSLSKRERERYGEQARRAARQGKDVVDAEARRMMEETVRNVRNYSKDGRKIATGGDLFDLGDLDVCEDVVNAVMCRPLLERGLAKKLRSRSASPSLPATKKNDGGAAVAIGESGRTTQEIQSQTTRSGSSTTPPSAGSGTATETSTPT